MQLEESKYYKWVDVRKSENEKEGMFITKTLPKKDKV